ncbi:hypothetical protein A7A76_19995 [Lysobacter enzymogenes]|nr:hypothetical protein [Lysobacter enzymogenes]
MVEHESRTLFLLLAEFGTGHIPVERCAHHFGMSPEEAKNAARRQQLPVPAFRLGSQKSPWLVSAQELANLIDERARRARDDWSRVQGAA